MKTILLMWAWWDARNKANARERLPSIDEVIRKATNERRCDEFAKESHTGGQSN
jgi:hypothetical protein